MQDADAISVPEAGLSLAELDDAELLSMARQDNQEAYAALFTRYTYAAHRLARHLGQREEAEDVVSESFAQVLDLVRRGKGPDRAFRAYLFTTIRHESARRAKARQRVVPTDDDRQIDSVVPFGGGQLDEFERSAIRAAYESLPDRWRTVLWHLDVEGRKPHELGPLLDLSANSVSALVYRARSGLRDAYLQQHVKEQGPSDSRTCLAVRDKLSTFVRRTGPSRDHERVHAHLETCSACMGIYLDLQEVNREVGVIMTPVALAVSVAGVTAGATVTGGLGALVSQALVMAKGAATAVAAPAAAAAVTTATVVGFSSTHVSDPPRFPAVASVSSPDPYPRALPPPLEADPADRADDADPPTAPRPADLAPMTATAGPAHRDITSEPGAEHATEVGAGPTTSGTMPTTTTGPTRPAATGGGSGRPTTEPREPGGTSGSIGAVVDGNLAGVVSSVIDGLVRR